MSLSAQFISSPSGAYSRSVVRGSRRGVLLHLRILRLESAFRDFDSQLFP